MKATPILCVLLLILVFAVGYSDQKVPTDVSEGVFGNNISLNKGAPISGRSVQNDPQGKILICHKGKTIEVANADVPAHLAHGDTESPCEPAADIIFVGSAPPPGSQVSEAGPFEMTFTVVATRELAEHSLHVALGAPASGHPVFTADDCASVHSAPFSLKARKSLTVTVDFDGDPPRSCTPLPFTTTVVGAALEPCDVDPDCHDFGRAAVVRHFNLSYTFVP
jgi:hypothetical protein